MPHPGFHVLNNTAKMKTKNGRKTATQEKRTPLYSSKDKSLDLENLKIEAPRSPFDDSPLNWVIEFIKRHGIAAVKIGFMIATAASTYYGGLAAGADSWPVRLMIWGMGGVLEAVFAFSWVITRAGS